MGTKTITPSSNNDGQIGSSSKYWNKGYFNTLHVNDLHTSSSSTLSANGISITSSSGIIFEGSGVDDFETVFTATNPTEDRVILLPNASGTVALTSSDITGEAATVATITGLAPDTAPTGTFLLPASAAAQTNVTSLGTLLNLDVDNININGDTITASADLSIVATGNDIAIDTDNLVIESLGTLKPSFTLKATSLGTKPSELKFIKDKNAAGADGDYINQILYQSDNDAQEQIQFASIITQVRLAADGAEEGKLAINIKNTDHVSVPRESFLLSSNGAATDVNLGYGAGSITTIAGTLTMGSTAAMTNAGLLSVAIQPNVTSLGTLTGLTTSGAIELGHASDTTLARSAAGIVTIDGKQIFTTNTPALTSAAAGVPAVTMQIRRTITTAEANDMDSVPIELVPAQGANTVIVPLGGMIRVDRAASQTNASADLNLHYESLEPGAYLQTSLAHVRRFMYGETGDRVLSITASVLGQEIGQNLTDDVDKAVEISFDSATTSNCFTSIEVFLTYQVFNIA